MTWAAVRVMPSAMDVTVLDHVDQQLVALSRKCSELHAENERLRAKLARRRRIDIGMVVAVMATLAACAVLA